ncbi:MAG: hypothetical protein OEQ29_24800 [Alphaproteobacteria bacterium]|nr:hypothetical protein [Alphaproteobacteria bacterium]
MAAAGGKIEHESSRVGVAVLANDRVYDWLIAFLESFRQHNPDLPLFVLPYDDRTTKVHGLAERYRFTFVDHDFAELDRFARRLYPLHPVRRRRVRKFGALDLDLDTVIYADIDTVVLHGFDRLAGLLRAGEAELIYASRSPGFVYRPGYRAFAGLEDATEFSDGFFVTARRFVSTRLLIDTVCDNLAAFRAVRQSRVYTQPILNFVVHTTGVPVRAVSQVTADLSDETYYKGEGITRDGARFLDKEGRRMLLMHWAGSAKLKDDETFAALWHGHRQAHDTDA